DRHGHGGPMADARIGNDADLPADRLPDRPDQVDRWDTAVKLAAPVVGEVDAVDPSSHGPSSIGGGHRAPEPALARPAGAEVVKVIPVQGGVEHPDDVGDRAEAALPWRGEAGVFERRGAQHG